MEKQKTLLFLLCRSRRELTNAYLLAKFRFDTAENEPSKVWPIWPSASNCSERAAHRGALGARGALRPPPEFRALGNERPKLSLKRVRKHFLCVCESMFGHKADMFGRIRMFANTYTYSLGIIYTCEIVSCRRN